MSTDVFLLVGDCLRAATASDRTLPFCRRVADLRFERCYAPSTWTLPVHASLYAGSTPLSHGVTRWGDRLDPAQAWLPDIAREHGYATALVSENPTFSANYGFDHGIDVVDDFVNAKLWPSGFAPESVLAAGSPNGSAGSPSSTPRGESSSALAGRVSATARSVVCGIARSDRPVRTLGNALYAPLSYGRDWLHRPNSPWPVTRFPHHGDRVCAHLRAIATARATRRIPDRDATDAPLLAVANVLEPHNPHSVAPRESARELGLPVPVPEQHRLAAVDDNKHYFFEFPQSPPLPTRAAFGSWDEVFDARETTYEAQVRAFDRVVERWAASPGIDLGDALVVVTGDHGQLFGEEGMVGHHTSLHPHGIHVPLLVSVPDSWVGAPDTGGEENPAVGAGTAPDTRVPSGAERVVDDPVSLVGLSRAVGGVVTGEVEGVDAFVDRVLAASGGAGPVVTTADGPNWNVTALESAYGADAVADLAVRKVGLVGPDRQVVLASPWDDDRIAVTEYDLVDGDRRRVAAYEYDEWRGGSEEADRLRRELDSGGNAHHASGEDCFGAFERWLAPERSTVDETTPAENRLRALGYR